MYLLNLIKLIWFQCNFVHTLNGSARCPFVKSTDSCHIEEGLIDYTIFIYCSFKPNLIPVPTIILVSKEYDV